MADDLFCKKNAQITNYRRFVVVERVVHNYDCTAPDSSPKRGSLGRLSGYVV